MKKFLIPVVVALGIFIVAFAMIKYNNRNSNNGSQQQRLPMAEYTAVAKHLVEHTESIDNRNMSEAAREQQTKLAVIEMKRELQAAHKKHEMK